MKAYSLSRGFLFLGGAALLFLQNQVVAKPRSVWDGVEAVMKDCDDFGEGGEVAASGTVTILRPLHCKTPMICHISSDTVIRSHDLINTTNVHFIVNPEASLIFTARAIVMARDEASSLPVLQTSGEVHFNVTGWTPSYTDGGIEDEGGVVQVLKGGDAGSTHPVHFTNSAFTVANEQARDEPEFTIKLSPFYEQLLEEHHAGLGSPKKSVGITAARKASRQNAASPELTLEYRVSSHVTYALHEIIGKAKLKANDATTPGLNPAATPSPPLPASPEHSVPCPKNPWTKKPNHSLQVGEQLRGTLRSEDGRSAMWPGVDGSLRFGKFLTPTEEESGTRGLGFGIMEATNLLASESDKGREALILRRELQTEGGGGGGGGGGGDGEKPAKAGANWFSWRQASKQRQREIAADNVGEVRVSVSNKGCVKATVDGTTVLSKSGRFSPDWVNRLPWTRPTDEGYQVHVTESGMEVRLGERTVWGIKAND